MLLVFAAALLLVTDQAPPAARPAPATSEKKICRTFEVTGSRLAKQRVCMTADEWRMEDAVRNREVEEAQRRAATQR
jgi:hypothetical protein